MNYTALDILDGSPPCSSFSMAGNREKDWGRRKTSLEKDKANASFRYFVF
jgi:site-specific DNA-cytosine methylase